ncbi:MAG TPA: ATP-binding protein, partial [Brevundimonas sp.]
SAVITPYLVYAAGLPVFAAVYGLPILGVVNLAIACVIILVVSLMVWRLSGQLLDAEESALEDATARRNEADAANAAKSAFVSTVSHELRTPMSAILAGAAALQERCEGSARNHAALIVDAGAMMQTLLDDLLDHAKIEAGRLDIEVLPMDARALVAKTVGFWRSTARRKGLRLRVEGARDLPRWVLGDPTRLRQILNNLLSNALKFTDRGVVTLRIKTRETGVLFEIQDTGPGLTPDQIARLFQPFEQGAAGRARTHGGTGLGLSISRNLARLMGGDLTVESRAGDGATFRLATVLTACSAPPPEETEASDPAPQQTLRTLIVDDHEINQRAFGVLLEAIGAQVSVADSGEAALRLLAVESFDLVLMDVNMAGLSGIETTRRIRAGDGCNREVPIIAVTGSVEPGDVALYLAAGMDRVVPKPVTPATLFRAIEDVLSPGLVSDPAPSPLPSSG